MPTNLTAALAGVDLSDIDPDQHIAHAIDEWTDRYNAAIDGLNALDDQARTEGWDVDTYDRELDSLRAAVFAADDALAVLRAES